MDSETHDLMARQGEKTHNLGVLDSQLLLESGGHGLQDFYPVLVKME